MAVICMDRIDMLQWLLEKVKLPIEPTLLDLAILSQNSTLRRISSRGTRKRVRGFNEPDEDVVSMVQGDILTQATMNWFHASRKARDTVDIGAMAYYAVRQGNIEWFKALHSIQPSTAMPQTDLIDVAAEKGHIAMIRHLVEIGYTFCSRKGVDRAVLNGHLAVVQFFHQFCPKLLSEGAFRSCAPLRVIKFLLRNHNMDEYVDSAGWKNPAFRSPWHAVVRLYELHPELFQE